MTRARPLAAGNWKMHGTSSDLGNLSAIAASAKELATIDTVLCVPATLIDRARGTGVALGGQDCHANAAGAHTGDISPLMLADAGASHVIVGHSERRTDHGEDNATVASKARAAWGAGLVAVICIGETEAEYRAGDTLSVLRSQLAVSVPDAASPSNTVIAYEPVWAIGSGLTPELPEIQTVHAAIREGLSARLPGGELIPVLYGGSVKPANADNIFALPDVDGGLVGGASLSPADFVPIMQALARQKGNQA